MAVIVTYNPDLRRLSQNIEAVELQVNGVLVFDNASANAGELERLLSDKSCIFHLDGENVGLSKALNALCSIACGLGATHALLLDQDSVAGEGMVRTLIARSSGDVAMASPQIVDRNKGEGFEAGRPDEFPKRAITSGALVSLRAWNKVGSFDERLFVDWVDYEFCANLRAHGYRIARANGVMLLHEMGRREFAFSLPLPGRGARFFYRTNHPLSRQRDKARSWAIVRRKYGWSRIGVEERAYIAAVAMRDLLLERDRLSVLKAFLQGARSGRKAYAESERVGGIVK